MANDQRNDMAERRAVLTWNVEHGAWQIEFFNTSESHAGTIVYKDAFDSTPLSDMTSFIEDGLVTNYKGGPHEALKDPVQIIDRRDLSWYWNQVDADAFDQEGKIA